MRTVFENGVFHTLEGEGATGRSLVVEDGVIAAIDGSARGGDRVVDMGGAHVYPALIDAHLHLMEAIALASVGEPVCVLADGRVEPHDLAGEAAHLEQLCVGGCGRGPAARSARA